MTAAIAGTIVPRAAAVASRTGTASTASRSLTNVRPVGGGGVSKGQVASAGANAGLSYTAGKRGSKAGTKAGAREASAGGSSARRILIMELMVCVIVLALSPLSSPEGTVSARDWMKRGTGVCALFIILGMLAAAGPRAGKVAAAFGGVVTLVLVIDQRSVFALLTDKLKTIGTGKPPDIAPGGPGDGDDVGTWNPGPIPQIPGVPGIPGLPPMPPLYRRGGFS